MSLLCNGLAGMIQKHDKVLYYHWDMVYSVVQVYQKIYHPRHDGFLYGPGTSESPLLQALYYHPRHDGFLYGPDTSESPCITTPDMEGLLLPMHVRKPTSHMMLYFHTSVTAPIVKDALLHFLTKLINICHK